jgi:membrane protease subunit HflC
MNAKTGAMLVVLVGLAMVLFSAVYLVDETQQVIITQFGDPVGDAVTEPGMHFKMPFIQQANFFDKRFATQ